MSFCSALAIGSNRGTGYFLEDAETFQWTTGGSLAACCFVAPISYPEALFFLQVGKELNPADRAEVAEGATIAVPRDMISMRWSDRAAWAIE